MGHTDMRKGMQGLALMVQQQLVAALQRADEAEARAANAVARESAIEAVSVTLHRSCSVIDALRPLIAQRRAPNLAGFIA